MTSRKTRAVVCIPARFASTRFPGKLLEKLDDKSILSHVVEAALRCEKRFDVVVLAGDKAIEDEVKRLEVPYLVTKSNLRNGTERIANVLSRLDYDYFINVQADDPTISSQLINRTFDELLNSKFEVVTPVFELQKKYQLESMNIVKVVLSTNREFSVYFSRQPLPLNYRGIEERFIRYGHIGIYGYRRSALKTYESLQPSMGEELESLEQLRFIENGIPIGVFESNFLPNAIDSPEDLRKLKLHWGKEK